MEIENVRNFLRGCSTIEKSEAEEEQTSSTIERENIRSKQLDNDIKSEDKEQRKHFASKIFVLTICYLSFVALVLLLVGFRLFDFFLSDAVMITLLGTTTATMIGVFNFVMKYLFNKK